jgi:hypothetical protein
MRGNIYKALAIAMIYLAIDAKGQNLVQSTTDEIKICKQACLEALQKNDATNTKILTKKICQLKDRLQFERAAAEPSSWFSIIIGVPVILSPILMYLAANAYGYYSAGRDR